MFPRIVRELVRLPGCASGVLQQSAQQPVQQPEQQPVHQSDVTHRVRPREHRRGRRFFPHRLLLPAHALTLLGALALPAQTPADEPGAGQQEGQQHDRHEGNGARALRLFLDCDWGCDSTFLRREVNYVNWVRDAQDAEVHLLVTIQAGGSSREYTLNFMGLGRFRNTDQKLIYTSSFTDTADERRRGFQRLLELGLVRYVLETPQAAALTVEFAGGEEQGEQHRGHFHPRPNPLVAASEDPWNHWVYRVRMENDFRTEDRRSSQSYQANVSAGRTTDMLRVGMGARYSYRESNFEFEDGDTFKNVSRGTSYYGQLIRTLAPHWGAGVGFSSRESTFLNLDNSYRAAAAVEYNVFPYSESSEREFTFAYFIGGTQLDFEEITVFDQEEQSFADQGAYIAFGTQRPWGEAHLDLQYRHFIEDFDRSRIVFSTSVEYRILRGLSFDVYAGVSRIRDQIYLPKGGATDEEVLVARRQLETDLTFRGGIELRYTFGSIYNNVVNSRLSSGSSLFSRVF